MEDFISTLIYLALTLVLVIGGVISRKKKNKGSVRQTQAQDPLPGSRDAPKPNVRSNSPIDKLFSSFIEEYAEEPEFFGTSQTTDAPVEVEEKIEKTDEILEEEGMSVFAVDDPATEKIETDLAYHMESSKYSDELLHDLSKVYEISTEEGGDDEIDFDARQAIIYSEIINPKY